MLSLYEGMTKTRQALVLPVPAVFYNVLLLYNRQAAAQSQIVGCNTVYTVVHQTLHGLFQEGISVLHQIFFGHAPNSQQRQFCLVGCDIQHNHPYYSDIGIIQTPMRATIK